MWSDLWQLHKGKISGLAAGLFLSTVYLFFGFWDMLVVAAIVSAGYITGRKLDRKEGWFQSETVHRWMNKKWRKLR